MTFSSGGLRSLVEVTPQNHSNQAVFSAFLKPETLSIIVEKTLMILMAVDRACYAYATRADSALNAQPQAFQSTPKRKGGSHS